MNGMNGKSEPITRRWLLALGGLSLLLIIAGLAWRRASPPSRFSGSFIQLTEAHRHWTARDWERLMQELQHMGLNLLIVQWAVHDQADFLGDALPRLLDAADAAHVGVLAGLAQDSAYWSQISGPTSAVTDYLNGLTERQVKLARRMVPLLLSHHSVEGWFITEEVDDLNWTDTSRRDVLAHYLADISAILHEAMPQGRIAISGFSNGAMTPDSWAALWSVLLKSAPDIDTLLFQDGIGVGKLAMAAIPAYLEALSTQARKSGVAVWAVVEIFRQTAGPPLDNQPFRAEPASESRITRQMALARPHVSGLIAFSIPEYMSSRAGPAAIRLKQDYLAEYGAERAAR
jgi:hypothetical protein